MGGKMKMEITAVPAPFQGHLNPMLRFCQSLSAKGLSVTLLLTHAVAKSLRSPLSGVTVECISDGSDGGGDPLQSFEEYLARLRPAFSDGLARVIVKKKDMAGGRGGVVVYDALLPWLSEVGRACGMPVAAFFTQAASVCSIYYRQLQGIGRANSGAAAYLPAMDSGDLPSFSYFGEIAEQIEEFTVKQASNLPTADCLLFNTFYPLEEEVLKMMANKWNVKTIGPLVPNRCMIGKQDRIDLFKVEDESYYMKWLDKRESHSVVYISFGSISVFSEEEMEEIAMGLAMSNKYFLWVVRESEDAKLPKDFKLKTSEKGVIVKWCSQVEVLSHRAIACFVTHCGWNSTLEALTFGVPMVGIPQNGDQITNAKFIEDVWRVGIRIKVNDDAKIVLRHVIASSITQVTERVKAEELWKNIKKFKTLAKEATSEGGSADVNIKDFITQMSFLLSPISNYYKL
ncbi:unnamed protein product [Cuscuta campestris]|uniref:Glycosyltransferase n=1 Tax=Cuscuta campestris TaxID=132261 RepID=A0A484L829_9ASTE|nr:unnamed protein product [Cuscuta campestris]